VTVGQDRSHPASSSGLLWAVMTTLVGIAGLALITLLVDPLNDAVSAALRGDTSGVRESIRDLGIGGPLIVLGLCIIHSVLWYPAEIVDAAAGFVFGFWGGFALVMVGWLLNAWIAYAIGHSIGHPLMNRLLGRERFERAEAMVARGGVMLLLSVRLIPIFPFSVISYACGAARVPFWRYTWTSIVGYTPITAISTYLGSRLEDLHPTDPIVIGSFVLVIVLMIAMRWLGTALAREEPGARDDVAPETGQLKT
jgi:uncharacterized membrane protein YdjX (TVP38/TMEM64 family)